MPGHENVQSIPRELDLRAQAEGNLDQNEFAVLELLAARPISFFPPLALAFASRLAARGFVAQYEGGWHITSAGLNATGRTVH